MICFQIEPLPSECVLQPDMCYQTVLNEASWRPYLVWPATDITQLGMLSDLLLRSADNNQAILLKWSQEYCSGPISDAIKIYCLLCIMPCFSRLAKFLDDRFPFTPPRAPFTSYPLPTLHPTPPLNTRMPTAFYQ
jgi:hypothetical protein